MLNPASSLTQEQSLRIFADQKHQGTLGGSVDTFLVLDGNVTSEVTRVSHYPGDNEYGFIFEKTIYEDSVEYSMIGKVVDSEIYCLGYVE